MEALVISDFIDVRPCRKVDVCVLFEREFLSVNDDLYVSFEYKDHEVVFRLARRVVTDVVSALYLTCEDVVVYVSDAGDVPGAENHCGLSLFLSYFSHL